MQRADDHQRPPARGKEGLQLQGPGAISARNAGLPQGGGGAERRVGRGGMHRRAIPRQPSGVQPQEPLLGVGHVAHACHDHALDVLRRGRVEGGARLGGGLQHVDGLAVDRAALQERGLDAQRDLLAQTLTCSAAAHGRSPSRNFRFRSLGMAASISRRVSAPSTSLSGLSARTIQAASSLERSCTSASHQS